MAKLSNKKKKGNKLNPKEIRAQCHVVDAHPLLSFAHVTTNKNYNFNYFKQSLRENLKAREKLDELLGFITGNTWTFLGSLPKEAHGGYETLAWGDIREMCIPNYPMTPDTTVYVFRFANKYRMVGVKPSGCHELKIIAYDFEYGLYDHGP